MKKIFLLLLTIMLILPENLVYAQEIITNESMELADTQEPEIEETDTDGDSMPDSECVDPSEINSEAALENDVAIINEPEQQESNSSEKLTVKYSAHVQNIGWQSEVVDGATAGSTGKALRLEALKISLDNSTSYTGDITYCTHVENIGWQSNKISGEISGTTGKAYRVEAIRINLTGELAEHYDVYYRTHIEDIGWMPWTTNGSISGSTGLALRMEAVEIRVVAKNDYANAPAIMSDKSYVCAIKDSNFTYSSHVQNIGDMPWVSSGNNTGTTGKKLRMEGVKISISQNESSALSGSIMYRTHVQDIGWTEWKSDGQYSGTTGKSKRIEAVQIKLTGQLALFYDVYYSCHIQDYGWLGWASNGQIAGSAGISYRMEALKIKLVRKKQSAPGSTTGYYKNKPLVTLDSMSSMANSKTSSTKWLIMVDTSACKVGIYNGQTGDWNRIALWSCSPGKASTPTVKGEFKVAGKGKSFGSSSYTCWYYTQFYGNYLFHSVLYKKGSMSAIKDGTLGKQVSHGCVRLELANAKWIYDNIPRETKVVVY